MVALSTQKWMTGDDGLSHSVAWATQMSAEAAASADTSAATQGVDLGAACPSNNAHKARVGQAHWHDKAKDMREIWNKRHIHDPAFAPYTEFQEQMDMCTKLHIKSQNECLLRELHFSVADGLITPKAFSTSQNDSFLGWTGFLIESTQCHEFRKRIELLFPKAPQENTLHIVFRRTGLVPAKWVPGWAGTEPFNFDSKVKASYDEAKRKKPFNFDSKVKASYDDTNRKRRTERAAARAQAATTAVPASAPAELPRPQPQRLFPMRHEDHMVVQEVQDAGHFLVAIKYGSAHNEPGLASANRGSAQRYGSETYFNSRNFTHAPTAAFAPVVSHRDPLAFGDGRPHIMGFPHVNAESLVALSSVLHSKSPPSYSVPPFPEPLAEDDVGEMSAPEGAPEPRASSSSEAREQSPPSYEVPPPPEEPISEDDLEIIEADSTAPRVYYVDDCD